MAQAGVNRAIWRPLILGVGGILVVAYATTVRARLLKWGATSEEVAASYPGDDLIALPTDGATMATTLPVPPTAVWPWLVQMGGDRGGWYGWDWLDNAGRPSATNIHSEWQELQLGQHLDRVPKGPANWFTVVVLEPERTLVLRAEYALLTGQPLPHDSDRRPVAYVDGIWGFHLRPTDGGRTRLVVRSRSRSGPARVARPFAALIGEPTHFLMQIHQFHNLTRRMNATVSTDEERDVTARVCCARRVQE